jgi:hypothetical protein
MNFSDAIVSDNTDALLKFPHGTDGDALNKGDLRAKLTKWSCLENLFEALNFIVVELLLRGDLSHVTSCTLEYLEISDLEVKIFKGSL